MKAFIAFLNVFFFNVFTSMVNRLLVLSEHTHTPDGVIYLDR